ncbi:MAG TPA: DUF1569 domain-containing protein [Terriglobales bacterium]
MPSTTQRLAEAIHAAVDPASERELLAHGVSGKWSAAEVLEHLRRTYAGTCKGLERLVNEGKSRATTPSLKQRVGQFAVITLGKMPEGRTAPKETAPKDGEVSSAVRDDIFTQLTKLDGLLDTAEQKFGNAKIMDHPVLGALSPKQWRKFHYVHGMHHVKQLHERIAAAKCMPQAAAQ